MHSIKIIVSKNGKYMLLMPIFDKKWSDDGLELALDVQNYYQVAYKTIQKAFS